MHKAEAEKIMERFLKPVLGFAMKRCRSDEDAEDLSQEIILKAYKALILHDDIDDVNGFIWRVAHNTLSNYYRAVQKSVIGIPVDEVAELLEAPRADEDDTEETVNRLRSEIAYLSKQQREIVVAYYFDNKKQEQIARELGISVGTVKWHLFEAKKELKKGMEIMREASDLKFNPIKFAAYGINGSVGTKSPDEFFRSVLSQNICYSIRNTPKTTNEIADDLGVSPVFIEGEVEFLEEYGFLKKKKNKYIINFLLEEPTTETLIAENNMYRTVAATYANELFDALTSGNLLDDERIMCRMSGMRNDASEIRNGTSGMSDVKEKSTGTHAPAEKNFLLWTLIPFIAACSGEPCEKKISFDEVATIRPDGGVNIFKASVGTPETPKEYVQMKNWCGPMWNTDGKNTIWQIVTEWSDDIDRVELMMRYAENCQRILELYERSKTERLSKEEYAWLAEKGLVKVGDRGEGAGSGEKGLIKAGTQNEGEVDCSWQIVILKDKEIAEKLLNIGTKLKKKHEKMFEEAKQEYISEAMKCVPPHMRKAKEFEMQYMFGADGRFLLHCLKTLVKNGKLKEPARDQKKSLTTMIMPA